MFSLPDGIFLPCDHGLDFLYQLRWEFNQAINQTIHTTSNTSTTKHTVQNAVANTVRVYVDTISRPPPLINWLNSHITS